MSTLVIEITFGDSKFHDQEVFESTGTRINELLQSFGCPQDTWSDLQASLHQVGFEDVLLWRAFDRYLYSMAASVNSSEVCVMASHKFAGLAKSDTLARQLEVHVEAFSEMVTNLHRVLPKKFTKHAEGLVKLLDRFVAKIEKVCDSCALILVLKNAVLSFQQKMDVKGFVEIIETATLEVRKCLILHDEKEVNVYIGAQFLSMLETTTQTFRQLGFVENLQIWSMYAKAQTNKMSLYLPNVAQKHDLLILKKYLTAILNILDQQTDENSRKFTQTLIEIIHDFEYHQYALNTFFQRLVLELDNFVWASQLPRNIPLHIVALYSAALDEIQLEQKVIKTFLMTNSPEVMVLDIQTLADRVCKVLHQMVPEYNHQKVSDHLRYFGRLLDVVTYRLSMVVDYQKTNELAKDILENLRQIQKNVSNVLQTDINFNQRKASFGVYVQDGFMELRRLGTNQTIDIGYPGRHVFADYLQGLENLLNQLQFDFKYVMEPCSIETLRKQMQNIGRDLSKLLRRTQAKHELIQDVHLQTQATTQALQGLLGTFQAMGDQKLYWKYTHIITKLRKVSQDASIEKLCHILTFFINSIIADVLELGMKVDQEIFNHVLTFLGTFIARLENIHYYEYYQEVLNHDNFSNFAQKTNDDLAVLLHTPLTEEVWLKKSFVFQVLRFSHHLQYVADDLQERANSTAVEIFSIVGKLIRLAVSTNSTIQEIENVLSNDLFASRLIIRKTAEKGNPMGVREGLIKYMVGIEKLYVNIANVVEDSKGKQTLPKIFTRIDRHVYYLSKSIKYIHFKNEEALDILSSEYDQLLAVFCQYCDYAIRVCQTTKRTWSSVDEVKIGLIQTLEYMVADYKERDPDSHFEDHLEEFLVTVQAIHLEIGSKIHSKGTKVRSAS